MEFLPWPPSCIWVSHTGFEIKLIDIFTPRSEIYLFGKLKTSTSHFGDFFLIYGEDFSYDVIFNFWLFISLENICVTHVSYLVYVRYNYYILNRTGRGHFNGKRLNSYQIQVWHVSYLISRSKTLKFKNIIIGVTTATANFLVVHSKCMHI